MKQNLIIVILICAAVAGAQAQSLRFQQDTLVWQVTELLDKNVNETIPFSCTFITYPEGKIEWIQKDGEFVTVFSRRARHGSWNNVNNIGTAETEVETGDIRGSVRFTKNADGIGVEFFFPDTLGINTMPFFFSVSTINRRNP